MISVWHCPDPPTAVMRLPLPTDPSTPHHGPLRGLREGLAVHVAAPVLAQQVVRSGIVDTGPVRLCCPPLIVSSVNPIQQVSPRQRLATKDHSVSLRGVARWATRSLFHALIDWHSLSAVENVAAAIGSTAR